MRKLVVVIGVAMLASVLAAASEQSEVMAPVHQFVDGFNKGDAKTALATCAGQASIIDDFAPYRWHGEGACAAWAKAYSEWAKQNGVTDGVVTLSQPRYIEVVGDTAYVVVPASFEAKQNGKPMKRETGALWTLVLHKGASGWLITAWTWSHS